MLRRPSLPLALGLFAFVLAAVGALGPAKHLQTRYSWPPRDLPTAQPDRFWYAPLLLAQHEPQAISARLPCVPPRALLDAADPTTVLATARNAPTAGGLAVVRAGVELRVEIAGDVVARTRLPSDRPADPSCAYRLMLGGGQWSLTGGPGAGEQSGSLERMPKVHGLFSGLDLRSGDGPSIEITTAVHSTRPIGRQTVAWALAVIAALTALVLVATDGRSRRPWGAAAQAVQAAKRRARPADGVVALVLLGWWVIGPAFYDDGWVLARQRNFSDSGGFSAYYTSFGVNLPLDYWLEWIEHWLTQSSTALLALRLPALLCLAAIWILCRWVLHRTTASSEVGLWPLASAFAVGAMAWGMTLRPEPVVAVLVTGVLACAVRFVERESAAPLAVAGVLAALALSAHPAGIVAFAPLAVVAPRLVRWARPRLSAAGTIVLGSAALLATLAFVGSDLRQRRADAVSLRAYGDETAGWRDELSRYSLLSQAPYSTGLRRASVALIVLAVAGYLFRRRRESSLLDLPAAGLGVALLLLTATPTKWPWHFGALIGLAAVAAAAETVRVREDARGTNGWHARPLFVVGAATLAAGWSWFPRSPWNDLDLRTLDWTLGLESRVTLAKAASALPIAVLIVLLLVARARRGGSIREAPWWAAAWTVPVLAVPLIAFTAGVLVADSAKTRSWTLARQNLGEGRCGLADEAVVPASSSMRALTPIGSARATSSVDSLPVTPVDGLPRYTLGPPPSPFDPSRSSWFTAPSDELVGFFVGGAPSSSDRLELEWGRTTGGRVERLGSGGVSADFGSDAQPELVPWRFVAATGLPARPARANAIRLALRSDVPPGSVVALTAPVAYGTEPLIARLESAQAPTLALPSLVTYIPCAREPRLGDGIAQVPGAIIGFRHSIWPLATGTSPFEGVFDLYQVRRLPLTDSANPPEDVAVYEVDLRIPGAELAQPVATRIAS